tara:strand:- start:84 stop:461 length:378 start_codon:yes stop_codon:yes gene_type:complete
MNKKEYIKKQINNLKNPLNISEEILSFAKNNNIIIVFLKKDDHYESLEIKGFLNESFDFWNVNSLLINNRKVIPSKEIDLYNSIVFENLSKDSLLWNLKTDLKHESFNIKDYDNSNYCFGLIIEI